jgi:hypothetical protein
MLKNQTCIQGLHRTQNMKFYYPSGLLQADPDSPRDGNNTAWAWGYGDYQHQCIKGIEDSIRYLIRYIDQHGPFIGIMGFSSGAALATIITSLLEGKNTIIGLEDQVIFCFRFPSRQNLANPALDFSPSIFIWCLF